MKEKIILIIGGYGRAGRYIAKLLADFSLHKIVIAGRSLQKAENFKNNLQSAHSSTFFQPVRIDVTHKKHLAKVIKKVHLVIVCIPLNYKLTRNIIEAILQSRKAHYIDLSPAEDKYRAFLEYSTRINQKKHQFILDAGFEPGLQGFLANHLLSQMKAPKELLIESLYRDPDIPDGGIRDILKRDENGKKLLHSK